MAAAPARRGGGIVTPVGTASGNGDEQEAGAGLAGIAADTRDVDAADAGGLFMCGDSAGDKIRKTQGFRSPFRS